ncbi:MAG: hypothetical protein AAFP28_04835 [Pseudomonadota bacterium]
MRKSVFVMLSCLLPMAAMASPEEKTCKFLAVMGANNASDVEGMLAEIAPRFDAAKQKQATDTLRTLAEGAPFAGGSAWTVLELGDDLVEHLVLFRLKAGEIAGSRLRYEWSPDGPALTNIEFHRQYNEYAPTYAPTPPQAIDCS